ncbi:WD40/YVTN/BNR-like repeat-containing protein [Horticoccus sp. 23ND18S-11]|uniref:WD40/YVTN/BNR-like repeat-containing protein n=1 Tax=Horticoccus sp. 23ND18S-11 TaxID=3391832 RepID=UPI0039C9333D
MRTFHLSLCFMFGRFPFACTLAALSFTVLGRAEFSFTTRNFRPGGGELRGMVGANNRLVAVGNFGRTLTSTDGQTWIAATPVTTDNLNGIAFGSGTYVAVGDSGRVVVSADGERWSTSAVSDGLRLNAVTHGNGVFVAVGDAGRIFTSEDGRVWVRRAVELVNPSPLRGIGFEPAVGFVAGGDFISGARSNDAFNWVRGLPVSRAFTGSFQAAVGNRALGQVAALTDDGSLHRATSFDVMSAAGEFQPAFFYTESVAPRPGARFRGLIAGGRGLLAVGDGGLICSIAEFLTQPWPVVSSGTTSDLLAGTFHNGTFYVVGGNEVILQSAPPGGRPTDEHLHAWLRGRAGAPHGFGARRIGDCSETSPPPSSRTVIGRLGCNHLSLRTTANHRV